MGEGGELSCSLIWCVCVWAGEGVSARACRNLGFWEIEAAHWQLDIVRGFTRGACVSG